MINKQFEGEPTLPYICDGVDSRARMQALRERALAEASKRFAQEQAKTASVNKVASRKAVPVRLRKAA